MSSGRSRQTTNQTMTPTNPAWVTSALQGYTGQVGQFGANTNARDLVAPASELQTRAFDQAGGLTTPGQFGEASDIARGAVNNGSMQDFMSPYTQDVVDTTLANYDQNAGVTRANQAAAGARNRAFGGSRYGVLEGTTEGELARGRASAEAQLRDQAFNVGSGLYGDAQNRNLGAAGLLSNIGSAQGTNDRSNVGLLADLGGVQRGIDADSRTAELSMLQALGSLYGQGQYGLFNGQNSTSTTTGRQSQGLLGGIGQAAGVAGSLASLFSDRRLKRNIVPLGGGWYAYNYLWSDDLEIGVMADEQPHAAMEGPGGYQMVNYALV